MVYENYKHIKFLKGLKKVYLWELITSPNADMYIYYIIIIIYYKQRRLLHVSANYCGYLQGGFRRWIIKQNVKTSYKYKRLNFRETVQFYVKVYNIDKVIRVETSVHMLCKVRPSKWRWYCCVCWSQCTRHVSFKIERGHWYITFISWSQFT